MENKENAQIPGHPEGCRCFSCCGAAWGMHRYGPGFIVLRWLLGLLILLIVFWLGVKIGELKSAIGYGYGYGGMHDRYMMRNYNDGGYYGYPWMMQPVPLNQNAPAANPPAASTPKTLK